MESLWAKRTKLTAVISLIFLVVAAAIAGSLYGEKLLCIRPVSLIVEKITGGSIHKHEHGSAAVRDEKVKTKYYCPMHPTYTSDKPGNCPTCGMKLVPLPAAAGEETTAKTSRPERAVAPGEDKGAKYYCPMHPHYVSDKPGNCPICSMKLVPLEGTKKAEEVEAAGIEGFAPVKITSERQQMIGVRTDTVQYRKMEKIIRTVGRVDISEENIAHVHAKVSGWIEKVFVNFTWQHVHKGDPLVSIYSPELVSTQEEYLLALKARSYLSGSPFPNISRGSESLLEATRKRLLLWDITEEQIRELEERGKPNRTLILYSPVTGHVTRRNAFPNMYVEPNTELYTIVDHTSVWVYADIYEYEIPFVQLGQRANFTTIAYPGQVFSGRITYIWPHMEHMTRTLKIRMDFPNPDLRLKPEMYGNVEIKVPLGDKLAVPDSAVLDSGARQIVFVDKGQGYFEPREVKLGPKVDNYYVVLKGLKAGERVVTSGNFIIDSESRLKGAMAGIGDTEQPHHKH